MENYKKMIELLLEHIAEYSKTSYELLRLKTLDKVSDIISSFIPQTVVFVLIMTFLLFINLGVAFWVGEMFGEIFYGFFVVAAFYGITVIVFRLFFYKWIKRLIENYIIRKVLK